MSLPDNTAKSQLESIHFDTLLQRSLEDITHYSGKVWTDKGEHDPGISVLQALTWSTADLAYRHTFPIKDLLQPKDDPKLSTKNQPDVFPGSFGPEQVLTCAPITLEDYRRAILDLCQLNENGVAVVHYFQDIHLVPVKTESRQYRYNYENSTGHFIFGRDDKTQYHLAGNYDVYYALNRQVDDATAKNALVDFLYHNRHIGESFNEPRALTPVIIPVSVNVDLKDDWVDYETTLNAIVLMIEGQISPQARRYSSLEISSTEDKSDEMQGPLLRHGWISDLPPSPDITAGYQLDIRSLAKKLLTVAGVKAVKSLSIGPTDKNWSQTIAAESYPLAYALDANGIQKALTQQIVLSKRGQIIKPDKLAANGNTLYQNAAEQIFTQRLPVRSAFSAIPHGRYRDSDKYYPTSAFLPAAYGLKEPQLSAAAKSLTLYLHPFESWNYLQQARIMLLPDGLNFVRDSTQFSWLNMSALMQFGAQSSGYKLLTQDYPAASKHLIAVAASLFYTAEQELKTTDHLLSYFGDLRANRTLTINYQAAEYTNVQHGFLQQNPEINYSRGNIDVQGISGLQRIIAARLGRGAVLFESFDATQNIMGVLPFYIIENRQLLPPMPSEAAGEMEVIAAVKEEIALEELVDGQLTKVKTFTLVLTLKSVSALKPGSFIDLKLTPVSPKAEAYSVPPASSQKQVLYRNLLIRLIDARTNKITFYCKDDPRLAANVDRIQGNEFYASKTIVPSDILMQNFRTNINPADIQGLTIHARHTLSDWLVVGSKIAFYPQNITPDIANLDARTAMPINSNVMSVDRLANSFTLDKAPDLGSNVKYYYEVIPQPTNEPYSSTLSFVFQKDWLESSRGVKKVSDWIEQVVREEVPLHLDVQIHYLDSDDYTNFQSAYKSWQANGFSVGGDAYSVLEKLSLGQRPRDSFPGIGVMRIRQDSDSATLAAIKLRSGSRTEEDVAFDLQDTDIFFVTPTPPPETLPKKL